MRIAGPLLPLRPLLLGAGGLALVLTIALGVLPRAGGLPPVVAAAGADDSPPAKDFEARCQDPAVIRCFGFDTEADVRSRLSPAWDGQLRAQVVTDVKASGAGSLRFEVPTRSPANTSGSFALNFADDLTVQFGEGQEFYVQWRQRLSPEFLTPYTGGGGFKQIVIGEGDRPQAKAYSCTEIDLVVGNAMNRGFPQMYHSCGVKDGQYEGLQEPVVVPTHDFLLQNAIRRCLYSLKKPVPPCHGYQADQWMTFQVHVKVGTWYRNDRAYRHDSTVQLWVADEGKPSRLVIDHSPRSADCQKQKTSLPPCQTGYDLVNLNPAAKYGKLWLLPYNTGKSELQNHPTAYTWYDELIISRTRIPDPKAT
jgi:hypothetical protein